MPSRTPQARSAILEHPAALTCTLYRPDERDPDEELDLGDARIVIDGIFQPPAEWDAKEREDYFDGAPEEDFVTARIECEAEPGTRAYFLAEPGDYAAVVEASGQVAMFYVYDRLGDTPDGTYVLIREDLED